MTVLAEKAAIPKPFAADSLQKQRERRGGVLPDAVSVFDAFGRNLILT
jgi:hypothetical protein